MVPNLKTISDLSKRNLYISDLDELQKVTAGMVNLFLSDKDQDSIKVISFRVFFGKTKITAFTELAREIFECYPTPILEVRLTFEKIWKITSITPISIKDLTSEDETFFANSLENYSSHIWRLPREQKSYLYDIAILINQDEKLPPSDTIALKKFFKACEKYDLYAEFITKKDISKIYEFDALFIRETTSINNHTYRFSKRAKSEGLVVIDDPESILKCTNKIFISNLLHRLNINTIPGDFVSDLSKNSIDLLEKKLQYPMVVKVPDGSFSIGVIKANDRAELTETLEKVLKKSELILVQKFMYTKYDWRIGVLGGRALYACKYLMSKNHWQIYNHELSIDDKGFAGDSITLDINDVPSKILETAVRAAQGIGFGLYGVDLKEDENGEVYVVEINDNPSIESDVEDRILGDQLYNKLANWFLDEIVKKKRRKVT